MGFWGFGVLGFWGFGDPLLSWLARPGEGDIDKGVLLPITQQGKIFVRGSDLVLIDPNFCWIKKSVLFIVRCSVREKYRVARGMANCSPS